MTVQAGPAAAERRRARAVPQAACTAERRAADARSWCAISATASRRASTAATSSRPTPPAGSSASSATRTGSSRCARRSSRSGCRGPSRGRRDRGVRSRAGRDRDHGELAIRARISTSGRSRACIDARASARRTSACGSEGAPLDALTAARLARDGEKAGPVRHMCSGQHTVCPAALPAQRLGARPNTGSRATRRRSPIEAPSPGHTGRRPRKLVTAIDGCGVDTYAFRLREVARAYAMLADPSAVPANDPRSRAGRVADDDSRRDARQPRDGRRAARPARHLADEGRARPARQQGRDGGAPRRSAILAGPRTARTTAGASGVAIKIEDGDGYDRGTWAASVEALRQAGVLDGASLRELARYHRPTSLDPHGRVGAESIAEFELAPVGELVG